MDIYDYLKLDHQKVAHLFKLFAETSVLKRKQEILKLISQELIVHAHSEQETFYKFLLEQPQTSELARHGKKEHHEIEEKINVINKSTAKNLNKEVLKLKEVVEHHVKEEEGKVFRKAKKVISGQLPWILKEKMHYLKGKLLLSYEDKTIDKQRQSQSI